MIRKLISSQFLLPGMYGLLTFSFRALLAETLPSPRLCSPRCFHPNTMPMGLYYPIATTYWKLCPPH